MYQLNQLNIECKSQIKYLGVYLDQNYIGDPDSTYWQQTNEECGHH